VLTLRKLRPTHRFSLQSKNASGMEFPIFDRDSRLVGWTRQGPELSNTLFRHAYAELLAGGSVVCIYVQIDDPADPKRAGAPSGWREPWRCLALCGAWNPSKWPLPKLV
jgi:hypothetical protein